MDAAAIEHQSRFRRIVDGLTNILTGFGTARDKNSYSRYVDGPLLTVFDIETLLKDSALAKKVVCKLPSDALRAGFKVYRRGSSVADNLEEAEDLAKRANELQVTKTLYRGAWLGRGFGAAGIVLDCPGTGDYSQPLDDEDVTEVACFRACDRQDFRPAHWDEYGATDAWWWRPVSIGGGPVAKPFQRLHTSRVIWFGGAETTDRARIRNQYWDLSVLQALFNTLVAYDNFWSSLDAQVSDASQAVVHIQGFIEALASHSGVAADTLAKRFQLMDMSRSNAKMLVLDSGDKDGNGREDFEVIERPGLSQMDGLTNVYLNRFAADAGYPMSVLFEQAPAGSNASGESELILHFQNVDTYRRNYLQEPATRMIRLVARDLGLNDPDEWEIEWPKLFEPKPLDVASAEKMRVDSAIGLVTAGVASEEEVALSLPTIAPSLGLSLDREARKTALEAALKDVENRELLPDPVEEAAAVAGAKASAKPAPGGAKASKASGRATKAKANPTAAKNSPK